MTPQQMAKRIRERARAVRVNIQAAVFDVAQHAKATAISYAPKSPTDEQMDAARKAVRKARIAAGKRVVKKPRKHKLARRREPGGLERSIREEHSAKGNDYIMRVFVPESGAEASAYAKRIHDERGVTWRNLGPGSIAKDAGRGIVREKYLSRVLDDYGAKYKKALERAVKEGLKK